MLDQVGENGNASPLFPVGESALREAHQSDRCIIEESSREGTVTASIETQRLSLSWDHALQMLRAEMDPQIFAAYIKPLHLLAFSEARAELIIAAANKFVAGHLDKNLRPKIENAFRAVFSLPNLTIRFEIEERSGEERSPTPIVIVKKIARPEPTKALSSPSQNISPLLSTASPRTLPTVENTKSALLPSGAIPQIGDTEGGYRSGINPRYTFANYVVGNNNQFCHAAALRVAENPGQSYNPLFIYGGVGLGKTHILHSIGNAVLARNPSARVAYLSSEEFTNELIQSLRNGKMEEFKTRLRGLDVLLIDDIQFMSGKERTQEEFFHTFNALYHEKKQIVITSDKIPQGIPGLEERLHTRFSWGLTADLQAPDFETRVAILKRKATLESFSLPEDVAHFISSTISSNIRELEGALTRVQAVSSIQRAPITVSLAQVALEPLLHRKVVTLSIQDIKRAVADHFNVKVSDIISKRRTKNLSFPRHISMYLCRKHTTASYPEIGNEFGGRDHSSVIHAAQVVSQKIELDSQVRALVSEIERRLM